MAGPGKGAQTPPPRPPPHSPAEPSPAKEDAGVAVKPAQQTLNEYLDHWLEAAAKARVRPKTFHGYRIILECHIRPALGSRPLSKITPLEVQQTFQAMGDKGLSARLERLTRPIHRLHDDLAAFRGELACALAGLPGEDAGCANLRARVEALRWPTAAGKRRDRQDEVGLQCGPCAQAPCGSYAKNLRRDFGKAALKRQGS